MKVHILRFNLLISLIPTGCMQRTETGSIHSTLIVSNKITIYEYLKDSTIPICIRWNKAWTETPSQDDQVIFKNRVAKAFQKWVAALNAGTDNHFTDQLKITEDPNCKGKFAFTTKFDDAMSARGQVVFYPTETLVKFTSWTVDDANTTEGLILHELGHVFGLGDTYVLDSNESANGTGCRKGHPDSVMCNMKRPFSELQEDDKQGLRFAYEKFALHKDPAPLQGYSFPRFTDLGISFGELPALPEPGKPSEGFKVTSIEKNKLASSAGMRTGDRIVYVNSASVLKQEDVYAALKIPVKYLTFTVYRTENNRQKIIELATLLTSTAQELTDEKDTGEGAPSLQVEWGVDTCGGVN